MSITHSIKDPIRLLIVDDHTLFRQTFAQRLEQEPRIEVVATAADADEAINLAKIHRPDIMLIDIDMPGIICFDAVRTIYSFYRQLRVIFLSAYFNDRYIDEALQVQALGYLYKQESIATVIQAIFNVANGESYFSRQIQSRIVVGKEGIKLANTMRTHASCLSRRELETLRYIARGMTKKEIASTMHLSVSTVDNHCHSLMSKLKIHDRVKLARYAIREGLADS